MCCCWWCRSLLSPSSSASPPKMMMGRVGGAVLLLFSACFFFVLPVIRAFNIDDTPPDFERLSIFDRNFSLRGAVTSVGRVMSPVVLLSPRGLVLSPSPHRSKLKVKGCKDFRFGVSLLTFKNLEDKYSTSLHREQKFRNEKTKKRKRKRKKKKTTKRKKRHTF